jgi:hypothetical protein
MDQIEERQSLVQIERERLEVVAPQEVLDAALTLRVPAQRAPRLLCVGRPRRLQASAPTETAGAPTAWRNVEQDEGPARPRAEALGHAVPRNTPAAAPGRGSRAS